MDHGPGDGFFHNHAHVACDGLLLQTIVIDKAVWDVSIDGNRVFGRRECYFSNVCELNHLPGQSECRYSSYIYVSNHLAYHLHPHHSWCSGTPA